MIGRFLAPLRMGLAAAAALAVAANAFAAPRFWSVSPYEVRIVVALAGPGFGPSPAMRRALEERLNRGVRPLWRPTVEFAAPSQRAAIAQGIAAEAPELPAPPDDAVAFDKTVLAFVERTPLGLRVVAREHDTALDRWGAVRRRDVARLADAPEAIVAAAVDAFAPLAAFELDPDDPKTVRMAFRGAELLGEGFGAVAAGEVMLPYVRRVDRDGAPIPDGVRRVPWTYLVAGEAATDTPERPARVYSHARSPFGARRRGRIEQLALHVGREADRPTVLRLHDRNDAATPLAGYEVFVAPPGGKKLTRLGRSDAEGRLAIGPAADGAPIRMAHVKCGSSVVASLPIAVGVEAVLQTPLLDERKRLAAETKVAALREELVDLVARRRILAARIRKRLADEDVEGAEALLREVEGLPGTSQFNQRLNRAAQLYRADDPTAQRRLDRLFTETRSVLGSALDARETRNLANEVIAARRGG